jgi:hypothetical protein
MTIVSIVSVCTHKNVSREDISEKPISREEEKEDSDAT